jgi:hypothetical protein
MREKIWNQTKNDYLKKHYPEGDTDQIAYELGHSVEQVRAQCYSLGIKKSKAVIRRIRLASLELGKTMNEKKELPRGAIQKRIHTGDITIIGRVLTHRAL